MASSNSSNEQQSSRDWGQSQVNPPAMDAPKAEEPNYVPEAFIRDNLLRKNIQDVAAARPEYKSILTEAHSAVNGERQENYGKQTNNFQRIADMWRVILGVPVTPQQVAMCMIALKLARLVHTNGQHRDSTVDIAGYAECLGKINEGF